MKPQNSSKSEKALVVTIIILIVVAIFGAIAVVMISNKSQEPTKEEPAKEEGEKPGEVIGFDPGHELPDDEKLDIDRSDEYSDILKLYIKLNDDMSYDDLKAAAEAEIPDCEIVLGRDFGKIYSPHDTDNISFDYSSTTKMASYFSFSHMLGDDQNVVHIRQLEDKSYEFGNDALNGVYRDKNRAINAYLYYLEQFDKYHQKKGAETE